MHLWHSLAPTCQWGARGVPPGRISFQQYQPPPGESGSGSGSMTCQAPPVRRSVEGFRHSDHLRPRMSSLLPHRTVEVPVQGDLPRLPHCTSAPFRGVGARTRDSETCCLSNHPLLLDSLHLTFPTRPGAVQTAMPVSAWGRQALRSMPRCPGARAAGHSASPGPSDAANPRSPDRSPHMQVPSTQRTRLPPARCPRARCEHVCKSGRRHSYINANRI